MMKYGPPCAIVQNGKTNQLHEEDICFISNVNLHKNYEVNLEGLDSKWYSLDSANKVSEYGSFFGLQ